jgi:hypothetical protein
MGKMPHRQGWGGTANQSLYTATILVASDLGLVSDLSRLLALLPSERLGLGKEAYGSVRPRFLTASVTFLLY